MKRRVSIHGGESLAEDVLLNRISMLRLPKPETQVKLIPGRRFRFDVVWPEYKVAVELQGGVYRNGRHVRGAGYESDAEKSALAQALGYMVLYVTPQQVRKGVAGVLIMQALESRGWKRSPAALANIRD
jgi:hypothetical protein